MIPVWLKRIHEFNPWTNIISALLFMFLFYTSLVALVYIIKIIS